MVEHAPEERVTGVRFTPVAPVTKNPRSGDFLFSIEVLL